MLATRTCCPARRPWFATRDAQIVLPPPSGCTHPLVPRSLTMVTMPVTTRDTCTGVPCSVVPRTLQPADPHASAATATPTTAIVAVGGLSLVLVLLGGIGLIYFHQSVYVMPQFAPALGGL